MKPGGKSNTAFLQVGLLFSLGLTLVAFEWTTAEKKILSSFAGEPIDEQIDVVMLPPDPPKPKEEVKEKQENKVNDKEKIEVDKSVGSEIKKVDDDKKVSDDQVIDTEGKFKHIETQDSIVDDIPTIGVDDLDSRPYFRDCKQATFDERFKCSKERINKILTSNIKIPADVMAMGANQKANVVFIIDEHGKIAEIKVINATRVTPSVVEESTRLVKLIPEMQPGTKNGRPVRTVFRVSLSYNVR